MKLLRQLESVPRDASVLAQPNLIPHLPRRLEMHSLGVYTAGQPEARFVLLTPTVICGRSTLRTFKKRARYYTGDSRFERVTDGPLHRVPPTSVVPQFATLADRFAISSMIFSPWNRPFSMKIVPVSTPASAPPATNRPGDVRLEGLGVVDRRAAIVQLDAGRHLEIPVGVVADEQEDRLGRQLLAGRQQHGRRPDFPDARAEARRNRAFLDPVLDVGPHPVLDRRLQLRPAVDDASRAPRRGTSPAPTRPRSCRRRR